MSPAESLFLMMSWLIATPPLPPLPILPDDAPGSQPIACDLRTEETASCQLEFEARIVSRMPGVKLEAFKAQVTRKLRGNAPDTLWMSANIGHRRGLTVGGRYRFTLIARAPFAPFDVLIVGHTPLTPTGSREP
jgi:hypothetical protein